MREEEYRKRVRLMTKKLREKYYETGTEEEREVPTEPSQLTYQQGLGNFPAFYLEGNHCEKSDCGNCTNCFYSQYYSKEPSKEQIAAQCDFVLEHFDELVLQEQYGKNEFPEEKKKYPNTKPIFMTFSPTGSFFSEKEFPKEVRLDFLKKLKEKADELQRDMVLHIEAHAQDVLKEKDFISTSEESELLRELNGKCILGFESSDDWSRNVLYNKNLSLEKFEKAVSILQASGIEVGAFVFSGLMTHTDQEAKEDMINSVSYLKSLGVFPVLMFANCQSWTIPDLLIQTGNARLQEPYTVLDTTYDVMNLLTEEGTCEAGYYLIPEPVDGPPYPEKNIFFDRTDLKGLTNVDGIISHEILSKFRRNRNIEEFMQEWDQFRTVNPSYFAYQKRIEEQEKNKKTLEERLANVIELVINQFEQYVENRKLKDQQEKLKEKESYKGHTL